MTEEEEDSLPEDVERNGKARFLFLRKQADIKSLTRSSPSVQLKRTKLKQTCLPRPAGGAVSCEAENVALMFVVLLLPHLHLQRLADLQIHQHIVVVLSSTREKVRTLTSSSQAPRLRAP